MRAFELQEAEKKKKKAEKETAEKKKAEAAQREAEKKKAEEVGRLSPTPIIFIIDLLEELILAGYFCGIDQAMPHK